MRIGYQNRYPLSSESSCYVVTATRFFDKSKDGQRAPLSAFLRD